MGETIIVHRTGQAPLRVRGELLAKSANSLNNASPDYSGEPGRSEAVAIYRTATSKYVVAIHHITCWQGEHNTDEAAVFPSLQQCISYLADRVSGWMLKELISGVGVEEVAIDVE